ncbi:MAG: hypothetical protein AABN95_16085 [Acidobacteriota bacterium]
MGLDLADDIEDARTEIDDAGPDIFTDLCNLIAPTSAADGFGGSTQTDVVVASNVPCSIKAMRSPMQIQIGGGGITTLTHEIKMGQNAVTKLIRPHYKIVILAHHGKLEVTAHNPVTLDGSMDVFMIIGAAIHE